jgi:hypothetical protein
MLRTLGYYPDARPRVGLAPAPIRTEDRMEADRTDAAPSRPAADETKGLVVKATGRGALVLETENARRMMRRLREAGSGSQGAGQGPDDDGS